MKRPHYQRKLLTLAALSTLAACSQAPAPSLDLAPAATPVAGFEAETMTLPSGAGQVFSEGAASGGKALLIWSNATASKEQWLPEGTTADRIVVWVKADQCEGSPQMTVKVDGRQVIQDWVWQTSYAGYEANVGSLGSGLHKVEVVMDHDLSWSPSCDRNLRVDKVSLLSTATTSTNPFVSARLFVDPNSNAKRQADAWRSSRPADAAQMDKIASSSDADWFGDWSGDIRIAVNGRTDQITATGALPVYVAYNIPNRDCGSFSGGGTSTAAEYRAWIDGFATGLEGRKAAVVLEPDALALTSCLSDAQRAERFQLLSYATDKLTASGARVYLDAGNSAWIGAAEMAGRLQSAGISRAAGFALNVSNYRTTAESTAYGDDVARRVGKGYVVDTSRNGNGPDPSSEWCNPSGRALGERPTASTGRPNAHAYLWIKAPGESDGTCNGGPAAGAWWPDYALGLARRAAY